MEEHVQGSTEEKFLCVVAHYRIEYRPHAAISAHRVTSSREIGMRKRKYRCLSRCGAPENLISPKDASNGATFLPSFLSHFVFSSPHGTVHRGGKDIEMTNGGGDVLPIRIEISLLGNRLRWWPANGKIENCTLAFFGSGDNSSLQ